MSQRQLAEKLDVPEQTVSGLLSEKIPIGMRRLHKFSDRLGCPIADLIPRELHKEYGVTKHMENYTDGGLIRLPILGYAKSGGLIEAGEIRVVHYLALPEGLPGELRGIEIMAEILNYGDNYDLRMEDLLIVAGAAVKDGDLALIKDGKELWLRRVWGSMASGPDGKPHKFTKKSIEGKAVLLVRKF